MALSSSFCLLCFYSYRGEIPLVSFAASSQRFLRLQPFLQEMYEIQAKHEATFDALNLSLTQAQRYEARLKELGSRLPSADIRDALEKAVLPDHHIQGSSTATHHLTTLTHTN